MNGRNTCLSPLKVFPVRTRTVIIEKIGSQC